MRDLVDVTGGVEQANGGSETNFAFKNETVVRKTDKKKIESYDVKFVRLCTAVVRLCAALCLVESIISFVYFIFLHGQ